MNFDRIRKRAGYALTSDRFFKSKSVYDYLKNKANRVLDSFHLGRPSIRIYWDEEDPVTAYTDNSRIVINAGSYAFSGSDAQRLKKILGALFHEIGHILFTNFTAFRAYRAALAKGYMYPTEPYVSGDDYLLLSRLKLLYEDAGSRKILDALATYLFNCLEDGREEAMLTSYVRGSDALKEGLMFLRASIEKESPDLSELEDSFASGDDPFTPIMQLVLYYARFRRIKGFCGEGSPLSDKMFLISSYVDDYVSSPDAMTCLDSLNKILVQLEPEIEDYIRKFKDDSGDGDGDKDIDEEPSDSAPALTEGEGDALASSISSSIKEAMSSLLTEDDYERGLSSEGSDDEEIRAAIPDLSKHGSDATEEYADLDLPRLSRLSTEDILVDGDGDVLYKDAPSNVVSFDLDRLKKDETDAISYDIAEEDLLAEYEDLRERIDFGSIHKGCTLTISRHAPTDDQKAEYERLKEQTFPAAKAMARKSGFFEKERIPFVSKGNYFGSSFDASRIAKNDLRYFKRTVRFDEPPSLSVSLVIDESGSMSGKREIAARQLALIMYDYVSLMEKENGISIPLNIIGHTSGNVGAEVFVYTDSERPDPKDRYRLSEIHARSCNRDGLPIRLALARLEEMDTLQKLLIVITDGQPSSYGYGGTAAEADLRDIAIHCEKEGILLIAAAIGDDKEQIRRIYGEKHFVDIEDLDMLPSRMIRTIRNLLC